MPYTPNPHHRSRWHAGTKSQWVISEQDEVLSFQIANMNCWKTDNVFWGLYLVNKPEVLGATPIVGGETQPLYVAKFVGDDLDNWHGYPVATWIRPWDRPCINTLTSWLDNGLISRPAFAKLKRSKRCDL